MNASTPKHERVSGLPVRLARAIERMHLSTKDFAERSGIPLRTLQNYIAGDREPGASALAKIASAGVDINWLLDETCVEAEEIEEHPFKIVVQTLDAANCRFLDKYDGSIEADIIRRSGVEKQMVWAAARTTDDLNKELIKENGVGYTVLELFEHFVVYFESFHDAIKRLVRACMAPPKTLSPIEARGVLSVLKTMAISSLGEDSTESVEAMVSLVRDKLNTDGHELDNGQARD